MQLKATSFRANEKIIFVLNSNKLFCETYDEFLNRLIDECEGAINYANNDITETLSIYSFKLSSETIGKLSTIAKKYRISRSEAFRKLIIAKAEGLC
ncbi:transcriptional regulator [Sulfolobus islandicus filamentous virus]|uniref:Uncharacterized protein 29 n=1 Tax=Sulfolobus islandicus filamentous virus (isolate Iceland/Hveragerdi) TaxID=654908 RepID=Y029_SIFVH|nr:transcriptional regulator [Sulfolobus islandicus filamentous virus]Q914K1.1 RecName: Full=Uncharacterized protein 29 [Sulfolobus islandicus filamentous virus (isolate Hveragerdi)]AAL27740.1 conserved hypothetical protein [Sulfolobus islandicus filamentous virus]